MDRIYLDYNATAPTDPRVLEAMLPHLKGLQGNPSSPYGEGRAARRAVEDAREQVAALVGGDPREIIFTSGATEANNLALRGLASSPRPIAVSAVEHPSVLGCAEALARAGCEVTTLPVDGEGVVDLAGVDRALEGGVQVMAVMAANNEVGSVQPWSEIAERCRSAGCALHVDAVQIPGKRPLAVPDPGRGTVSLSAHKMGGPKGIGALWVRTDTQLQAQLVGGGQERLRRAGTENVAATVGFGAAAQLAMEELDARIAATKENAASLLTALRSSIPHCVLNGPPEDDRRLPGTLNLRIPGVAGESLMLGCDLAGVALSLGSACSSGSVEPSHVLAAMGVDKVENLQSVRISVGWTPAQDEMLEAARRIIHVVNRNRKHA